MVEINWPRYIITYVRQISIRKRSDPIFFFLIIIVLFVQTLLTANQVLFLAESLLKRTKRLGLTGNQRVCKSVSS